MKRAYVKNKGFTIVELLIVIAIIGILAAISVIAYTNISNRAKDSRLEFESSQVIKGAKIRLGKSGSLDLPASVNNANAMADYMYYQPLGDKVLTTAYNYTTGSAIIGSEAEALEDYPDKNKLRVSYGVSSESGGVTIVAVSTYRWSHLDQIYQSSTIRVYSDGRMFEETGSRSDCNLTPDRSDCQYNE